MTSTTPARAERDALCDLFLEVGPDVPTLCEGWTARDLAAHLVVRERRPDIARRDRRLDRSPATASRCASPRPSARGRSSSSGSRTGPPVWNPMRTSRSIDSSSTPSSSSSTTRTSGGPRTAGRPRRCRPTLEDALATPLRPDGRRAHPQGRGRHRAASRTAAHRSGCARASRSVTISGPIGEGVLYVYGRKDVAEVDARTVPTTPSPPSRAAPFGL